MCARRWRMTCSATGVMSMHEPLLQESYDNLLARVLSEQGAAEPAAEAPPRVGEMEVQMLWQAGLLGREGETVGHGSVRIISFGEWNRGAGPDFLNAEWELDGQRVRGDIEIDPRAQDWEHHGHGENPLYNRVALHIVLTPPPAGWYTRNALHQEVPVFPMPQERVSRALGMAPPLDSELVPTCRKPLEQMSPESVQRLLLAAAAHRAEGKRRRFHRKAEALGRSQAWYEALAETLGYSANKTAMLTLARRAPLHRLQRDTAEAILLGTAGFLVPMLPDRCGEEARLYHRMVWDTWWVQQQKFSLEETRSIAWSYSGIRPLNHPHRRVAALAICAAHWRRIEPMLCTARERELRCYLEDIHHPFWELHSTLASPLREQSAALIGRERITDFLVNHVYVMDESPDGWQAYLHHRADGIPNRVQRIAEQLFGARADIKPLLRLSYVHQGLLQIAADFCTTNACCDCLFPEQLSQWR